mmetsp:Transcript_48001/g.63553  ORF Transcript_48001/g.63553 Transcript_48001/m.63553 type:complete len:90 (+) Transcript_48001:820-1089(+)
MPLLFDLLPVASILLIHTRNFQAIKFTPSGAKVGEAASHQDKYTDNSATVIHLVANYEDLGDNVRLLSRDNNATMQVNGTSSVAPTSHS